MTSEVVHTERGRALLLPDDFALPAGPVEIMPAGPNSFYIRLLQLRSADKIAEYFDGPYEDNGLREPADYPPDPFPSF